MHRHLVTVAIAILSSCGMNATCVAQQHEGTTVEVLSMTATATQVEVYRGYYVDAINASGTVKWIIDEEQNQDVYCTMTMKIVDEDENVIAYSSLAAGSTSPTLPPNSSATQTLNLSTHVPASGTYTVWVKGMMATEGPPPIGWFDGDAVDWREVVIQ